MPWMLWIINIYNNNHYAQTHQILWSKQSHIQKRTNPKPCLLWDACICLPFFMQTLLINVIKCPTEHHCSSQHPHIQVNTRIGGRQGHAHHFTQSILMITMGAAIGMPTHLTRRASKMMAIIDNQLLFLTQTHIPSMKMFSMDVMPLRQSGHSFRSLEHPSQTQRCAHGKQTEATACSQHITHDDVPAGHGDSLVGTIELRWVISGSGAWGVSPTLTGERMSFLPSLSFMVGCCRVSLDTGWCVWYGGMNMPPRGLGALLELWTPTELISSEATPSSTSLAPLWGDTLLNRHLSVVFECIGLV